jgi:two-component system sensor histidine kinase UhpB
MLERLSLTSRVVLINGLLFSLATLLLAVSPATVSEPPLPAEVVVLAGGLIVLIVANTLLVGAALRPLDRLVRELEEARTIDPVDALPVPPAGIAHQLATAVNHLLDRIDSARRETDAAALAAEERERARIAQELHDGVGQSLTAILLEIGALAETGATPEVVEQLREGVRSSLEEVRGVARQLRPHVLEDLGLRSALAALTNELFGHGGTRVSRHIMVGLPQLDQTTELVLFRVAQEALTNVARHARADSVELRLEQRDDRLELTVSDDGDGMTGHSGRGSGLRGMRERALLIGATLEIDSEPGRGTTVTLAVPLERPS